jgi:hypothetical protein
VSSARALWTVAVNDRQNVFADLRPPTTRIVNSFAASGAPKNAIDDAKSFKRKLLASGYSYLLGYSGFSFLDIH